MWPDSRVVEKKVIGHVDVDSGQVMIIDPCYVLPDERKGMPKKVHSEPSAIENEKETIENGEETSIYLRASDKSAFANYDNGIGEGFGEWGGGVITLTLFGDGTYPVIAELNKNKGVVRITIDFDPQEDEEVMI